MSSSRTGIYYPMNYDENEITVWENCHLKSHAIAGYLTVKGKSKWYALQGDRLSLYNKKPEKGGELSRKGFTMLGNITQIECKLGDETSKKHSLMITAQENGKTNETVYDVPTADEARYWVDVLNWARYNFLRDKVEENILPPELSAPRPFSGWLKRKTVNGWKNRYFVVLAHQIKWYLSERMVREDTMGYISLLAITGVYDGQSNDGKLNPAIVEMGIPKSKLDCAFFIDRSTSPQPLCLLAPTRHVKAIWLDALKRVHTYLCSMEEGYIEEQSDMDNDDAEEELIITKARLDSLVSFVPQIVVKRFIDDPNILIDPESTLMPNAAVLFADISGFTSLAESLAKKQGGGEGAEILCKHLNAYFGKLVELIHLYGGDVIKYAGDALLALWSTGPAWLTAMSATQCALDIQTHTAQYSADSVTLTLHIGISAGAVTGLHLGGVNNRWEYLIGGQPMLDIAQAEGAAKSGEVVLTGKAWNLVNEHCTGKNITGTRLWKLESINTPTPYPNNSTPEPSISLQPCLRPYIPITIRKRIDLGLGDWMAELRRVTIVFAQLNVTFKGKKEQTEKLHQAFRAMQTCIYDFDGIIRQFIIDDKGSVLVAAFYQHEDDPLRAIKSGLKMVTKLNEIDVKSSIGVTTGKVFLGAVGSTIRREFAMVGDTVNLSARLMCLANNCVLCDNFTYQAAQSYPNSYVEFTSLNSIKVKGKKSLIPIFLAANQKVPKSSPVTLAVPDETPRTLVGRESEVETIMNEIKNTTEGARTIIIEGEEGIGKSLLTTHIRNQISVMSEEEKPIFFDVGGESSHSFHPFYPWHRSLILKVLGFSEKEQEEVSKQRARIKESVLEFLKKMPKWLHFAALLNDILQTDIPEEDSTKELDAGAKTVQTSSLIAKMLATYAESKADKRIVVLVDDGHFLDSASYSVLVNLKDLCKSISVIVACRITISMPLDYNYLLEVTENSRIKLGPLSVEKTGDVLRQCLDVDDIPGQIIKLIHEKSSGNPYFSQLLVTSLVENETIKVLKGGRCVLSQNIKDPKDIAFPDSLENLVISRIGRLTSKNQFVLKVASVIGMQFEFRLLVMIYPIPDDKDSLQDCIYQLQKLDFITAVPMKSEATYRFTQTIVQECCYNLLLFQQRRTLHAAVAEWHKEFVEDLRPHHHRLGFHYELAEMHKKASIHYEFAANESTFQYNSQEAVTFFSKAIQTFKVYHEDSDSKHNVVLGRMENGLGESYTRLGMSDSAIHHFELALRALNQPIPKDNHGAMKGIKEAFKRKGGSGSTLDEQEALQSIRAYENLAYIFYTLGDKSRMMTACLQFSHLSNAMNFEPELARAHGILSVAARVAGDDVNASKHVTKAMELSNVCPRLLTIANVCFSCALSEIMCGILSTESLANVLKIYDKTGQWRRWCEAADLMCLHYYLDGNFEKSIDLGLKLVECGSKHDDKVSTVRGYLCLAKAFFVLNKLDDALNCLLEAEKNLLLDKSNILPAHFIEVFGFLAHTYARLEDYNSAAQKLNSVFSQYKELPEYSFHLFLVYCDMVDTCFKLWLDPKNLRKAEEREKNLYKDNLFRLCAILEKMCKAYPVSAPRGFLRRGQIEWMLGNLKKAKKMWDDALVAADAMALPYERALVLFEVGTLTEDDQEREELFSKGVSELDRIGVPHPPVLIDMSVPDETSTNEDSESSQTKKEKTKSVANKSQKN